MSLKKRIEMLERDEEGREEFEQWEIVVDIGKVSRTLARNSATGQETQDPEFIHRVQNWRNEYNKRHGLNTEFVVIIGTPETGQQVYRNGELVSEIIPETISGIESLEVVTTGAYLLTITGADEGSLST